MKNLIKKIFTPTNTIIIAVLFTMIIFGTKYITNKDENKFDYTVSKGTIIQSVQFTGTVKGANEVEIGFKRNGKVEKILKEQGEHIKRGTPIAILNQDTLKTELAQAKASVIVAESDINAAKAAIKKADAALNSTDAQNRVTETSLESARINLEKVKSEQNTLVKNAYQALLNNDLQAYPVDLIRNYEAPVITGTYESAEEGTYILSFYHSNSRTGFSLNYSGLENGTISFDDFETSEPLGAHGLYIHLPESGNTENYATTKWTVPVPNTRSSTYYTVQNSYKQAKETAEKAIANAQATYDALLAQENNKNAVPLSSAKLEQAIASKGEAAAKLEQAYGKLLQAETKVAQIETEIEDGVLRAPFDGVIAKLDLSYGDQIMTSEYPVTIIGDNMLELDVYIPEIDVIKVKVGDKAKVSIDALPESTFFDGTLSQIDSAASEIDGVQAYKGTVTISTEDSRIRSGMSAHATIEALKKENVLIVPSQYITKTKDGSLNVILEGDVIRNVQIGVYGTNGFVEILNGIKEGEKIQLPNKRQ